MIEEIECPACLDGGELVCQLCAGAGRLSDPDDEAYRPECWECQGRGLVACGVCREDC